MPLKQEKSAVCIKAKSQYLKPLKFQRFSWVLTNLFYLTFWQFYAIITIAHRKMRVMLFYTAEMHIERVGLWIIVLFQIIENSKGQDDWC